MIDINILSEGYLHLLYHSLRAKGKSFNASLSTDFDSSVGKMKSLAQKLGRVILNLINNSFYAASARKQTDTEGYEPLIKLSTKCTGDWAAVKIKDYGTGMPKPVKEKVFQPFFATKSADQGSVPVLSISYDIVNAHGGAILVEGEEGKGTEFCIRLPIDTQ